MLNKKLSAFDQKKKKLSAMIMKIIQFAKQRNNIKQVCFYVVDHLKFLKYC